MGEGEVASDAEHDVDVELGGHFVVEGEGAVVEGDACWGEVVGAHDGCVSARAAGAEVGLIEHGDVGDAVVFGEIVGGGEAVDASADDDGVVGFLEVLGAPNFGPGFVFYATP